MYSTCTNLLNSNFFPAFLRSPQISLDHCSRLIETKYCHMSSSSINSKEDTRTSVDSLDSWLHFLLIQFRFYWFQTTTTVAAVKNMTLIFFPTLFFVFRRGPGDTTPSTPQFIDFFWINSVSRWLRHIYKLWVPYLRLLNPISYLHDLFGLDFKV